MSDKDIFTSLVRVKGNPDYKVVSVKSTKVLSRIYISTPIDIGDVICTNIINSGIDIVCTKKIDS